MQVIFPVPNLLRVCFYFIFAVVSTRAAKSVVGRSVAVLALMRDCAVLKSARVAPRSRPAEI